MNRSKNIILLLLCAQLAQAQGSESLQRAEKYRASGDLYNAAIQYEQYLGIRKGRATGYAPYSAVRTSALSAKGGNKMQKPAVYTQLAACYYGLHDYAKATEYFAQGGTLSADDALLYVRSLRASGRKSDARAALQTLRGQNLTPAQQKLATLEENALSFEASTDPLFTVAKAAGDVNTGHGNYAAVQSGSVLFFTSSRADTTQKKKGPNRNHIYRIVGSDALPADPITAQDVEQGLCTFTPDGRRAFFTVWKADGGKTRARIYTTTREDGGWRAATPLAETVNEASSNNAQPSFAMVNGTRTLFFSSDRAGAGGYDIWMARLDANDAVQSVSAVSGDVNTAGDEQAPFYHTPTGTLVFASNGHPGMGGYDLFRASGTGAVFAGVQNLGAPVNSVKDDSYFFSASKDSLFRNAFLSSDRASDCCLEIFSITRKDPPKPEPQPEPAKQDTVVTPPTPLWEPPVILFEFDKAELTAEAQTQLDAVVLQLQQQPALRLRIGGYTDSKGGEGYNNRLSDRRARAVQAYLVSKGIVAGRLWLKGFGECCPVAPETANGQDDPEARRQNRRVEIKIDNRES